MESDPDEIFFFQKLREEFPKVFSLVNFDDLPFDEKNIRYSNWEDVYNNMLEKEKDKFFKNLPRDIFNHLILFIPFEEILDFLNKICSHKPSYCDEKQDFWTLLWKRDINNYPPPFGVKEKYLIFVKEFNEDINIKKKIYFSLETNIQKKFYLAVQYGATDFINDLINQVDISAFNYRALYLAAENGHLEVVCLLANLGPEGIKAENYYALRSAALNGHLEIVRLLAELDPEGVKANNYEALRSAARNGHLEIVRFLADLGPEGIKASNYQALHFAARNGYLEMVRFLVDLDPIGIIVYNYTTLYLAAKYGHLEIVQLLLSKIKNLSEIPNIIKILIKDKFNIFI